jgi:hypothetical protein
MPMSQMVRLQSSPGFHQVVSNAEVSGWLGQGAREIRKRVRKLTAVDEEIKIPSQQTFRVLESIEEEDGFLHELAIAPVAGTPDASADAA